MSLVTLICTASIKLYKLLISPILPNACRFYPTCSLYTIEAIEKYGIFKGGFFAIKRIGRCHPFGGSGYDPVENMENTTFQPNKIGK